MAEREPIAIMLTQNSATSLPNMETREEGAAKEMAATVSTCTLSYAIAINPEYVHVGNATSITYLG